MNNLLSYCGLFDAKIRASDKDLPVLHAALRLMTLIYEKNVQGAPTWSGSLTQYI
jgi:hypothetical protein